MIQHRFIFVGNLYVMPNFVYFLSRLMPSGIKGSEVVDSSIFGAPIVYREKTENKSFLVHIVAGSYYWDASITNSERYFPQKINKKTTQRRTQI